MKMINTLQKNLCSFSIVDKILILRSSFRVQRANFSVEEAGVVIMHDIATVHALRFFFFQAANTFP